ncbi:4Fe-4S dicluster domain-containing protein [Mycolicibacter sp. MYC123]|uniref:4Fe-4S dicluster domain-containing protein n=1 Tax=[Mycobacterium] zoologicum TaxID=2872311 RepID=A0ABU5YLK9_9MYCO|nr:4Fe-4S dicluster domain-containing protein [Mycolicibacter sp. MYC123]MEB3050930.1 4Fe-4S dicluster domain-containing protein [Mycolicibacter sp. MYC123]
MGQLSGPTDPAADAGWSEISGKRHPRKGFLTDTSICIGCKACEVACKEWNHNPADGDLELLGSSYDNTGALGANTWRHVAFIEQGRDAIAEARESGRQLIDLGMPKMPGAATDLTPPDTDQFRWLMSSDVCKHCTHAGCLDVCPTGSLFRTEFGTVVVQDDICNGCGNCVPACPFGVIERRPDGTAGVSAERAGIAQKCTMCYDRLVDDEIPACAKTCPTESIKFGDHDDLVAEGRERVARLHAQGRTEARLYGANANDGVGGTGSVFLLLDEPEVYGLPPDPRVGTADLPEMFRRAGLAAAGMIGAVAVAFLGRRR